MKTQLFPISFALCLLSAAAGCQNSHPAAASQSTNRASATTPSNAPSANAATVGHGDPSSAQPAAHGTVRETMNAAGYTYMRIETAPGASTWAATMQMPVAVGDEVQVEGGNDMANFHSRTLDRTFEHIVFASGVRVVRHADGSPVTAAEQQPAPAAQGAGTDPGGLPPNHPPIGAGAGGTSDLPPGHGGPVPGQAVAANAPSGGGAATGVVRETLSGGPYTYLRVETANGMVWAAVPQMTVAVGDRVEVQPGSEMPGFHSRTLNRSFEQITFSPGARVLGSGGAAAPTPAAGAHGAAGATPPAAGHPATGGGAMPPGHPAI